MMNLNIPFFHFYTIIHGRQGSVKIFLENFLRKGGCQNLEIHGALFVIRPPQQFSGKGRGRGCWDPRPSYVQIIEFWNLENTCNYNSTKISQKFNFWNFKFYLILQFLSNHPETFRVYSRDHVETLILPVFRFWSLNLNYWILNIMYLFGSVHKRRHLKFGVFRPIPSSVIFRHFCHTPLDDVIFSQDNFWQNCSLW